MFFLLKTEFMRYRNRALLMALAHLGLLAFLAAASVDLHSVPAFNMWLLGCLVAACSFGILQMNSHKRSNHWIYLLQRPLAPWKIATALVVAGCLLILVALVLPFLLYLEVNKLGEAHRIELRYYLQFGQIIPGLLLAYLYACFLALYTHRFKFIGFTIFIMLIDNHIGVDVYLLLALQGGIAVTCLYCWFKPDLNNGARNPAFIILSELPLHFGLFWIVVTMHSLLLQSAWNLFGNGPLSNPVPGSVLEVGIKSEREILLAGLEGSTQPDAAFYRQQISLGEIVSMRVPVGDPYPKRHQRPSLDEALVLVNPVTDDIWRFSHDDMLYRGYTRRSDDALGWLGPQGFTRDLTAATQRFTGIPAVTANRFIVDEQVIYQLDWEQQAIRRKLVLADIDSNATGMAPERFYNSLAVHENFATLLSDRNFYIFRSRQLNDFEEELSVETRLPLPEQMSWRHSIYSQLHIMELIDGYLVSILMGFNPNETEGNFLRFSTAAQWLYQTRADGEYTLLNKRALGSGFSAAQIYEGFVLAPGFRILNDLAIAAVSNKSSAETWSFLRHRFPPLVLMLAFCSMIASGLVVHRLLRAVNLPPAAKAAWIAISAFSGWIGLASFWLGSYRGGLALQVRVDDSPEPGMFKVETAHA